jgi:ferrous iron transport protein B
MPQATIALAGNPNVGKSTLFNALTGARQHVGNWPGKTVEKKEGTWTYQGRSYTIVDLPGTYSLTAYSMEEIIARDYITEARPDAVVVVVDAANLERNLYLVVQIIEMGAPVIVALNMSDVADARGLRIDVRKLAQGLGVPVVPTVARDKQGIESLAAAIATTLTPTQES